MRYIITLLFTVVLIASSAIVQSVSASDQAIKNEIQTILEQRDQEIKEVLGERDKEYTDEQREKLKGLINDIVDYPSMARQALDEKFDELSAEEQERFTDLFAEVIRQQSMEQLDIYRAEVRYDEIDLDGEDKAMVHTTSILDNRRIAVVYRMTRPHDEWVIADISVDGVWTAESYKRSFTNILRRHGFDRLMESLERRADRA